MQIVLPLKVGRTDLGLGETVILTIEPAATPFAWSLINGGHSSISGGYLSPARVHPLLIHHHQLNVNWWMRADRQQHAHTL